MGGETVTGALPYVISRMQAKAYPLTFRAFSLGDRRIPFDPETSDFNRDIPDATEGPVQRVVGPARDRAMSPASVPAPDSS